MSDMGTVIINPDLALQMKAQERYWPPRAKRIEKPNVAHGMCQPCVKGRHCGRCLCVCKELRA